MTLPIPPELRATTENRDAQQTYGECGSLTRANIAPLREMMRRDTTLTEEEIDDIMSSSYEELRQPNNEANTMICESEESDGTEAIQEPVQELTPDSLPDEDWQGIDPLNKEYGTQWNGHDPNMEGLLKIPETPQTNNPENKENDPHKSNEDSISQDTEGISPEELESTLFMVEIVRAIQEKPKRFSDGVRQLLQNLEDYCPHQNMQCWEGTHEEWDEHLLRCSQHPIICKTCYRMNAQDWTHLQHITRKQQ